MSYLLVKITYSASLNSQLPIKGKIFLELFGITTIPEVVEFAIGAEATALETSANIKLSLCGVGITTVPETVVLSL